MKIRLQNELLLANILVILLIIVITFFPSNVLRIVLGLPFILFFPGYTLVAALFPRRNALDSIERLALSFGLSTVERASRIVTWWPRLSTSSFSAGMEEKCIQY